MSNLLHLLNAAGVTAKMIERRDTMRRLYGTRYTNLIQAPMQIIRTIAERDDKTYAQTALWLAEKALKDGNGEAINPIIAALVELCEEHPEP